MRGVLRYIGLRRRVTVVVPVAIAQVRQNLEKALQDRIILNDPWHLKRHYWGHISCDRLTLHGPNERLRRQLCFLTRGHLSPGKMLDQTRLELEIVLSLIDEIQLMGAFGLLVVILGGVVRPFGLVGLPFLLAFIYGMAQLHFSYYTAEIRRLLSDCMIGQQDASP